MAKKRTSKAPLDKPRPPAKKDPLGELEYSDLDGVDTPYGESKSNHGFKSGGTHAGAEPGTGADAPLGLADPLIGLELGTPAAALEVVVSAGIEEPADFTLELETEHKRAMLEHLRKSLEADYDRDKKRLRQQFGQGKM